jgi:AcrR family transcriptional regulator
VTDAAHSHYPPDDAVQQQAGQSEVPEVVDAELRFEPVGGRVAEPGDAGMDDIAARAGVAVGTLYRHFPTKGDLVAAIMAELGAKVVALLDAAASRVDSGEVATYEEIAALLRRVVVDMADDRMLRDTAGVLPAGVEQHARDILGRLVTAARADGSVHPDVTVDDLTLLLTTAPGDETPKPHHERWVTLALRALSMR